MYSLLPPPSFANTLSVSVFFLWKRKNKLDLKIFSSFIAEIWGANVSRPASIFYKYQQKRLGDSVLWGPVDPGKYMLRVLQFRISRGWRQSNLNCLQPQLAQLPGLVTTAPAISKPIFHICLCCASCQLLSFGLQHFRHYSKS